MQVESGRLRLFPLNTVLFPGAVLNLHIFEPRYKRMIGECLQRGESFGVALIREGDEVGDPNVTPHDVGTTAEIGDANVQQERYLINTVGGRRFRIDRVVKREPYLLADVTYLDEDPSTDDALLRRLVEETRVAFRDYLALLVEFSGMQATIELPADPIDASFLIGDALQVADSMKQKLLELSSTQQRLAVELAFLRRLLPQLRAMLEKKRNAPAADAPVPIDAASRSAQERFFGKHFSVN